MAIDSESDQHEVEPTSEAPRHGRARERQRRRRERRQTDGSSVGVSLPHLQPPGNIQLKMPDLSGLAQARWVAYVIGGAVLIAAIVLVLGSLKNDQPQAQPNAVWIGTEWTYEVHDPEDMTQLVDDLRENQIGTIYAWVSWLQEDETWRGAENFGAVREFATQFKEAYPESILLGWLSFPVNVGENNYRLDDENLQQNIADFASRVVTDLGYDGIFLNIEPVWNNDENFLALLRKVRLSLGEDILIALAIPPDWSPLDTDIPVPPLIVPGTVWDREYKQSVALLSDQMAVMAYNSGLTEESDFLPEDYSTWVAYQVSTFADAVNELGVNTRVLIGIPTYDAEPPGHDPLVENVASAIDGVTQGLAEAGDAAAVIQGLAIYAGWTTDSIEWIQYRNLWLDR
ncbi:MAG: hypothetical protein K8L99_24765 [Anaerolineae bacterium]|nr:hypothetical protein [Anaerolineae bacterium]